MAPEGNGTGKSSQHSDGEKNGSSPLPDDRLVWTKDETRQQIERLENQLSVAVKQRVDKVKAEKVQGLIGLDLRLNFRIQVLAVMILVDL
jgi:hypothetical protein